MDGRFLGLGLGEEFLLSLNWITFLAMSSLPLSFWGVWGVLIEGVFAGVGLILVAIGIVKHGPMKKSWAGGFMVASLILGIYALVLIGFITTLYQRGLIFCQDSALGPNPGTQPCGVATASISLGLVAAPNLVALGATFLFSWGWIVESRTGLPDTS